MKYILPNILFCLFLFQISATQAQDSTAYHWPDDWLGTWAGTMEIQSVRSTEKQYYPMKLEIAPGDTAEQWKWTLTYGEGEKADVRPYVLIAQDSAHRHFLLDEKNSILLDQYLIGNQFVSRFHVNNNLLIMHLRHEGDHLVSLITYGSLSDTRKSGEDVENVTEVIAYPIGGLQEAVLRKQ